MTLNIAGIHGTKDLKTEKIPLKTKRLHSKVHSIEAFAHPSISLGNTNYDYKKLKQIFNHLGVLLNKSFNFMEVGIIRGQDAYELQRPLDYKIETRNEPFAVRLELGRVVSGPTTSKRRQNVRHFAFTEDVKVAENNYSSAFGQLYSLERRFQRDSNLKSLYQKSIDTDVEKWFVKMWTSLK